MATTLIKSKLKKRFGIKLLYNERMPGLERTTNSVEAEIEKLNSQQRVAALHESGPALVLAGAGSGKTKVLTTRAAWLLETQQASSDEILLVTFTNKAAAEMKKRVYALVGV